MVRGFSGLGSISKETKKKKEGKKNLKSCTRVSEEWRKKKERKIKETKDESGDVGGKVGGTWEAEEIFFFFGVTNSCVF